MGNEDSSPKRAGPDLNKMRDDVLAGREITSEPLDTTGMTEEEIRYMTEVHIHVPQPGEDPGPNIDKLRAIARRKQEQQGSSKETK